MIPQHAHDTLARHQHPTTTPTEISEAIRILDENHKQQIMELQMRMKFLQQEYRQARQELETKLQHAVRSHEVEPTMSLPGLYPTPSSMMTNVYTTAPTENNSNVDLEVYAPPPLSAAAVSMPPQPPISVSIGAVPTASVPPPPMTSAAATTLPPHSMGAPLHYAAVLPAGLQGIQYQIQVNPDGSQQVIPMPSPVVTTSTAAAAVASSTASSMAL